MATITFTIPDAQMPRIIAAFTSTFNYADYVKGGGTMTEGQFTKERIRLYVLSVTRAYEVRQRTAEVDAQVPPVTDPDVV
jgi:hypothetical protein